MNLLRNSILNSVMYNRVRALRGALDELFYDFVADAKDYRTAHCALFRTVRGHVYMTFHRAYLSCIRAYVRAIRPSAPATPPDDSRRAPHSLALVLYEAPGDGSAVASRLRG